MKESVECISLNQSLKYNDFLSAQAEIDNLSCQYLHGVLK